MMFLVKRGYHSRNALTVAQLPFGACMEISLIAGIEVTNDYGRDICAPVFYRRYASRCVP